MKKEKEEREQMELLEEEAREKEEKIANDAKILDAANKKIK